MKKKPPARSSFVRVISAQDATAIREDIDLLLAQVTHMSKQMNLLGKRLHDLENKNNYH